MKQSEMMKFDCSIKEAFENGKKIEFPCCDKYMKYDIFDKKYYLTREALIQNGIDVQRKYISSSPNKEEEFIKLVTDDIYQLIMDNAFVNYEFYIFMIATGFGFLNFNPLQAREQILRVLLEQAKYRLVNQDVRSLSGVDFEKGSASDITQIRGEFRHISQISKNILKSMGLLYNGELSPHVKYVFYANKGKY